MKSFHLKPGIIISVSIACIFVLRFIMPLHRMFPNQRFRRVMDAPGWYDLPVSFIGIFLLALCCWLVHQYLLQQQFTSKTLTQTWVKGIIGVALCMALSYGINQLQSLLYKPYEEPILPLRKLFSMSLRGLIIGWFQYFMVYYIAAVKEAQQSKIEIEQLKKENLQARLTILKQQISPHFLFNSLSTLKTIASDHPTQQYIMQLSNVYRYLLNYNDNNVATLKDELAFTNSYLYILKERFEEALQLSIDVPDELLQMHIPPLSLQILIENAIKHNIISADQPLHIYMLHEDDQWLTVANNVQPKLSIETSSGMGLQNIRDRYQLLAGKSIDIQRTHSNFTVKLPLLPS